MIKERTGKECEAWLLPQISLTASNMVMIKRIENAIGEADLTTIVSGSMGQAKTGHRFRPSGR